MPFHDRDEMIAAEPLPGWSARFVHGEHMTVAHYDVAADAVPIHPHHHVQEEVWIVVDGEIAVTIDGVEHVLRSGAAAVVPSDVTHSARALGAARAVVADHPVRRQLPGSGHR